MTGKTHLLIGVTVGAFLVLLTDPQPLPALAMVAAGGLGGLFPDIDSPNSKISNRARPLRLLIFWIPHRTLTHSLVVMLAVGALGLTLGAIASCFAAGYASHVAADMTTTNGVPLFYPAWNRRLHLLPPGFRLTTGGATETLFYLLCASFLVFLILLFMGVDLRTVITQIRLPYLFGGI